MKKKKKEKKKGYHTTLVFQDSFFINTPSCGHEQSQVRRGPDWTEAKDSKEPPACWSSTTAADKKLNIEQDEKEGRKKKRLGWNFFFCWQNICRVDNRKCELKVGNILASTPLESSKKGGRKILSYKEKNPLPEKKSSGNKPSEEE